MNNADSRGYEVSGHTGRAYTVASILASEHNIRLAGPRESLGGAGELAQWYQTHTMCSSPVGVCE
jgi:hypothetical protein